MSEALKPVINFGFSDLELNRLYAYHMLRNPGSGKVLQKNGLIQEGVLRQRVRKWGMKMWCCGRCCEKIGLRSMGKHKSFLILDVTTMKNLQGVQELYKAFREKDYDAFLNLCTSYLV
jgi:hypothetical protein